MKKLFIYSALSLSLASCSMDVVNPNITENSFVGTSQSSEIWLAGMKKQLANTLNQAVVFAEIVSDNYYNNSSLTNKVFDGPVLLYSDVDIDNTQRAIARLREMGTYGIERIVPADKGATATAKAEMLFIKAYAHILSGELFVALPMAANTEAVSPAVHFNEAIKLINEAITTQTDATLKNGYQLALLRCYYNLGNRTEALRIANSIIQSSSLMVRNAVFDGLNGASNLQQSYTFSNSTNVLAPLPRLDFLDPKYYHVGNVNTDQKPLAILKSEEAFLVAAEAYLGNNQLEQARTTLKALINDVIAKRPTAMVDAKLQLRKGIRADYPVASATRVQADAQSAAQSKLVLGRLEGNVKVNTVSGTSVTIAELDKAETVDQLLYLLSLIRQQVFMSEGRRMTDLGIRFPVSQIEKLNNKKIDDAFTKAVLPAYIPTGIAMDDFTYDKANNLVVIKHDMNKVLVANKTAPNVFPMLK
ncbi:hypothetical protein [Polluticaenibacter yanchengensis]|uniref:Tetratricopeptide repeat protein n=1 Tax=Polluticaenibacter yanchengensis TaxID=3014562 RepID=A0ABT4UP92_9BACT|nr:hypothetical protein [Chitinophagaceae bacterium LY-5]